MSHLEVTRTERVSRAEAAARLRALASALARKDEVEYDRAGVALKVSVPDQIDFKLEVEVEDDECELEVELTWGRERRGRAARSGGAKRRSGARRR